VPGYPKFIVDECTGPAIAEWLTSKGFETISIFNSFRGSKDTDILAMAIKNSCVIITNDKDFGDMVFKQNLNHKGIILLRLSNERSRHKIEVLEKLLNTNLSDLIDNFTVVTETTIRIIKTRN
jgi:predicted nuclease of predicted toxin-antitoxin system